MCVMSMVMDHFRDKWTPYIPAPVWPYTAPYSPPVQTWPYWIDPPQSPTNPSSEPQLTEEEVKELKELLRRAKEYDKINNEPDCELESKKVLLKEIAKKMGIDDLNI